MIDKYNIQKLSGLQIRNSYPMMRRIANPPKQIGVKYYIILFYNEEFITPDFQWQWDVISKELTGA